MKKLVALIVTGLRVLLAACGLESPKLSKITFPAVLSNIISSDQIYWYECWPSGGKAVKEMESAIWVGHEYLVTKDSLDYYGFNIRDYVLSQQERHILSSDAKNLLLKDIRNLSNYALRNIKSSNIKDHEIKFFSICTYDNIVVNVGYSDHCFLHAFCDPNGKFLKLYIDAEDNHGHTWKASQELLDKVNKK